MEPLPANEIRDRFIGFFAARDHAVVPSASLVPAGDQTLLFTNSGMVQFKDVLRGVETRSYRRAVDAQRCLRVAGKHNDFEEVGRTPRHHTLFEMLGNWSFGDYFKREAIDWAWEFLTEDLRHPRRPARGDDVPRRRGGLGDLARRDRAAARADGALGRRRRWRRPQLLAHGRHRALRTVQRDPLRPRRPPVRGSRLRAGPRETCPRWLELWNLVFMEFDQRPDGRVPLPFKSVDTGMGLERLASVLQGVASNYDTDLFTPIHARMRELLGHDPDAFEAERFSYQVIADHSRAIAFLIADGVLPVERGPRLRPAADRPPRGAPWPAARSPRAVPRPDRARRHRHHGRRVPDPARAPRRDPRADRREEHTFARTLDAGTAQLEEALAALTTSDRVVGRRPDEVPTDAPALDGELAFRLHDTFGFPIDLTIELAAEHGVRVDRSGFEGALAEQRERSRSGREAGPRRGRRPRPRSTTAIARPASARPRSSATRRRPRPAGSRAIVRDGMEYDELEARPEVELRVDTAIAAELVLDETPFYAEGGGQVGDQGVIRDAGSGAVLFTVDDTQRPVGGRHRPSRHGSTAGSRSARRSSPRSTPIGERGRCATTPARTSSIGRSGTPSASRRARRAPSSRPTTCASTIPPTGPLSPDEKRAPSRPRSAASCGRTDR